MFHSFLAIAHAAEIAQETANTGGVAALGLDLKSFIFQLINFAILFFVLRVVAYGPILRVLELRRQKIEDSLKHAESIEETKRQLAEDREKILAEVQAKAQMILSQTEKEATALLKQAETKAAKRAEEVMAQAQARANQDIQDLKRQLEQETLELVKRATERLLQEKLDDTKDARLLRDALESVAGTHSGVRR